MHAACIGANDQIIDVILHHKFPPEYYQKWQLMSGIYYSPFDANAKDAMGQTCLYISCLSGNAGIVEKLMSWRVVCQKVIRNDETVILFIYPFKFVIIFLIQLFFGFDLFRRLNAIALI